MEKFEVIRVLSDEGTSGLFVVGFNRGATHGWKLEGIRNTVSCYGIV